VSSRQTGAGRIFPQITQITQTQIKEKKPRVNITEMPSLVFSVIFARGFLQASDVISKDFSL